jgi:hypothetical protein
VNMHYQAPEPVDREEAARILAGTDVRRIQETIINLALSGQDRAWVEEQALRLTEHPDPGVRGIAATALGHLATFHGYVSPLVWRALARLLEDPQTRGQAKTALDDLHHAIPR